MPRTAPVAPTTGPAGLTAEDWNAVGIPVRPPYVPSWLDDTPDWHAA